MKLSNEVKALLAYAALLLLVYVGLLVVERGLM